MITDIILTPDQERFVNNTFEERSRRLQRIGTQYSDYREALEICFNGLSGVRIIGSPVNMYNVAMVHGCMLAFSLWFSSCFNLSNELDAESYNAA